MADMIIFPIIELFASWIEIFIGFLLIGSVISAEKPYSKQIFIYTSIITGCIFAINQYRLFSILTTVLSFLLIACCSKILFKKDLVDTLVATLAYLLFLHILDVCIIAITSQIFQMNNFGERLVAGYSYLRAYTIIFAKICLIVSFYFLKKTVLRTMGIVSRKIFVGLFISLVLVISLEISINTAPIDNGKIIISLETIALIVLTWYCTYQFSKSKEKTLEIKLLEKRNDMMFEGYEKLRENHGNKSIFYHDMKTKLLILNHYLEENRIDEAISFLNNMLEVANMAQLSKWTNNKTIDFLINYKQSTAYTEGITLNVTSDEFQISENFQRDLCVLLGNLIDNAIEACRQEQDKNISLIFSRKNHMLFIHLENTCTRDIDIDSNVILTTKKEKDHHGIGLQSVQIIVQKYNGSIEYKCENRKFIVNVAFFDIK